MEIKNGKIIVNVTPLLILSMIKDGFSEQYFHDVLGFKNCIDIRKFISKYYDKETIKKAYKKRKKIYNKVRYRESRHTIY